MSGKHESALLLANSSQVMMFTYGQDDGVYIDDSSFRDVTCVFTLLSNVIGFVSRKEKGFYVFS
jgi:hypothetical protein